MRKLVLEALLLVALVSTAALAQPAQQKSKGAAIESPEMTTYRGRIDKAFLESGINISVTVQTKGDKGTLSINAVPVPALMFLGYINRATSYAVVTKILNSFAEARELGFKSVVFHGLGPEGSRYVFDLRKPPPTCSIDLCFD